MAPHSNNEHAGLARVCSYLPIGCLEVASDGHQFLPELGCNKTKQSHPSIEVARTVAGGGCRKGVLAP